MNVEEQRRLGVRLATEANAPKTLAAIKDVNSCYDTILQTAAEELGVDKLTSYLLENDPEWAFHALLSVSDIGNKREALIEKSSGISSKFIQTESRELTETITATVSGLTLYLAPGCSFSGSFTLLWQDQSGNTQPQTAYPNAGDWVWSKYLSISVNRQDTLYGSKCALPNAPIQSGDIIWMLVGPSGSANGSYDTGFRFKYDPTSSNVVQIDATGGADNPSFTLHQAVKAG